MRSEKRSLLTKTFTFETFLTNFYSSIRFGCFCYNRDKSFQFYFLTSSTNCSIRRVLSSDCNEQKNTVSFQQIFTFFFSSWVSHQNNSRVCLLRVYWAEHASQQSEVNLNNQPDTERIDKFIDHLALSMSDVVTDFWEVYFHKITMMRISSNNDFFENPAARTRKQLHPYN